MRWGSGLYRGTLRGESLPIGDWKTVLISRGRPKIIMPRKPGTNGADRIALSCVELGGGHNDRQRDGGGGAFEGSSLIRWHHPAVRLEACEDEVSGVRSALIKELKWVAVVRGFACMSKCRYTAEKRFVSLGCIVLGVVMHCKQSVEMEGSRDGD